jgi:hypothetical protein
MRRLLVGLLAVGILATGLLSIGTPAEAVVINPDACVVEDATLQWGFKESFRAYIDGSIANGEWTTADGATYETPDFSWSPGSGSLLSDDFSGDIAFIGSVRFTGHGGLLDTTIANPWIHFDDAEHATLLLDVTGVTMDGDPYSQTAVPFVTLDLTGALTQNGTTLRIDAAPTTLTGEGAVAFPNYEVGSDFDPVSVVFTVRPDCELEVPAPPAASSLPALVALFAGLVAAGLAVWAVVLIVRRRRRSLGA